MGFEPRSVVMDADQIRRAIKRISHEIVERNYGLDDIVIVGIRRRGVYMAERIADYLAAIEEVRVPVGALDITLYRDDFQVTAIAPEVGRTEINEDINDKVIILVDELIDFGRPKRIELAVLVDRGHREFPIKADYVGKNVPTSDNERVEVNFSELDGEDRVIIGEIKNEAAR